jgi:hypothetical protein
MDLTVGSQACEHLLAQLERRVAEKPISPDERDSLLLELDETSQALHHLQEDAAYINAFAQKRFAEMEQRIVFLHGRIHDQTIKFLVTLIETGAGFLKATADLELRAELIDSLKEHINFLFSNYSPSLEDRMLIFFALGMNIEEWAFLETEAVLEDLVNTYQDKKAIRPTWSQLSQKQKELFYAFLAPQEAAMSLLHDEKRPTDYEQVFIG